MRYTSAIVFTDVAVSSSSAANQPKTFAATLVLAVSYLNLHAIRPHLEEGASLPGWLIAVGVPFHVLRTDHHRSGRHNVNPAFRRCVVPFLETGADLVALPSCLLLLLAGPKVERALPLAWTGICYELKCPCVQEEQPLAGGAVLCHFDAVLFSLGTSGCQNAAAARPFCVVVIRQACVHADDFF